MATLLHISIPGDNPVGVLIGSCAKKQHVNKQRDIKQCVYKHVSKSSTLNRQQTNIYT